MLENLSVVRREGVFVVVAFDAEIDAVPPLGDGVEAAVRETEAVTLVATKDVADSNGWEYEFEAAWLTIEVHSALDAVGLTAALARVLTEVGVACNVLAGNFHDHVLVPVDRADEAIAAIHSLRSSTSPRRLGEQVWPDVERGATLLVPLGSTEQHGPHLPMDTDARIAGAVATRAAGELGAFVAPVLPFGASGEHAAFAGTLSIGSEALNTVIVELVRSAALTFGSIVLVNGHGGNHSAVTAAVAQLVDEGHAVRSWAPSVIGGDAHAGRTETSLMLAIAPETVQVAAAESGNVSPLAEIMAELRAGGVAAVSPNGVLGDPDGASAAEGRALLHRLATDLAEFVREPAR